MDSYGGVQALLATGGTEGQGPTPDSPPELRPAFPLAALEPPAPLPLPLEPLTPMPLPLEPLVPPAPDAPLTAD
ncbi:MAG TPA: hypothetical protein VN755_02085, partial [Steroidobacteraceae bacterium]|nr:hypothetical protein [Steroidobacteraceae bacterium]